jgi:hypothetical protein
VTATYMHGVTAYAVADRPAETSPGASPCLHAQMLSNCHAAPPATRITRCEGFVALINGHVVSTSYAAFGDAGREPVRRLRVARGARTRRLSCARPDPLGGCGRARHASVDGAGRSNVAADLRAARVRLPRARARFVDLL